MHTPSNNSVDSSTQKTTADILRERRLDLGLSHAELARYVSPSCRPSDIETLESQPLLMPSWIRLQQLAQALEVSVADLLPSWGQDDSRSNGSPSNQTSH